MASTKSINCLVGEKIRQLRIERGISQEELGFRSNLHRAFIGQIERAERRISINNLAKIAAGLEVHISDIFSI